MSAPFFLLASFFEEAFSGAPCSATEAVFSVVAASAFVVAGAGEFIVLVAKNRKGKLAVSVMNLEKPNGCAKPSFPGIPRCEGEAISFWKET